MSKETTETTTTVIKENEIKKMIINHLGIQESEFQKIFVDYILEYDVNLQPSVKKIKVTTIRKQEKQSV